MNDALLQLGVGGILAILVIREVLGFLRRRNADGVGLAGEQSVDYWRRQHYEAARQATVDVMTPMLLELHEIRSDTTRLRESQHRGVELQQQLLGKLDVLIRLTEGRA